MKEIAHKVRSILLIIVALPVIVFIAIFFLPLQIIASIIDIPLKKKRLEKLQFSIREEWIPNKRYIYLSYHTDTKLAKYIETQIIPKYGKNIVVDCWNPTENKWHQNWSDSEYSVKIIKRDIVMDYDDLIDVAIIGVSNKTNALKTSQIFTVCRPEGSKEIDKYVFVNSKKTKIPIAEDKILKEIQKCLGKWGEKL